MITGGRPGRFKIIDACELRHAVVQGQPGQFAIHKNMRLRRQGARVVQGAGFDNRQLFAFAKVTDDRVAARWAALDDMAPATARRADKTRQVAGRHVE